MAHAVTQATRANNLTFSYFIWSVLGVSMMNDSSHCRDACLTSSQEKIVYLPCIIPDKDRPDYLATVDVDPDSPTYSTVCLTCTQPPPTYCRLFRSYLVFTFPTLEMRSTTLGGMLAVLVLMIHQDQEAGRTVLSTWLVFTNHHGHLQADCPWPGL